MTARKYKIQLSLIAIFAAVALTAAGCGSSGSSSPETSSTSEPSAAATPFKGQPQIVKFGKPAPASDREAASAVLAENLEAREAGDFATQCASLTVATQEEVVGPPNPSKRTGECSKQLEELAKPLKTTEEIRANTFDGSIDELRMQGSNAYALYHGTDGKNYAMPLELQGGAWKVGSIVTTEIE